MITRTARLKQRCYYFRKKILLMSLSIGLLFCITIYNYTKSNDDVLPVNAPVMQQGKSGIPQIPKLRDVLFWGIPGLTAIGGNDPAVTVKSETSMQQVLRETILFFTNVDIKDMRSLLHVEIPILSAVKLQNTTVSAMSLPNFPKFEALTNLVGEKPVVGIYYTHTSESYIPSSGVAHKPGGQKGDIIDVGTALIGQLNKYNIIALQNTTIHDYPSFMKAYGASEVTAKKMLEENPSIQMLFDIHRDAEKRENCIATINGTEVARIMIVVATGQQDLVQPHWQQNHAFAKLIDAKLNQRYPGVSRGIRLDDWRYNQHLHPRALLFEVGCQENSKEEAERSMELLGDIIAEIIKENN